ncbi:hypothetical protein [Elizabethkingia meningoseptica]|uniref:hypothetical protein n=1 Tax=Elizabethkingia meningoseptica TaxID=238 RepID=UPI0038923DC1
MDEFKHLNKHNSGYLVKQYPSFQHTIVIAWILIAIVIIVKTSYLKTGIVLLVVFSLLTILSFRFPKTCIDKASGFITVNVDDKKRQKHYRFSDFEGFELQTLYIGFIPLGSFLYANFKNTSKLKRPVISQSFEKKRMQELYNELEQII